VRRQIARAVKYHALRIEWDNPDSSGLDLKYVLDAHDEAWKAGLRTIAKNPLLVSDPQEYCSHPSIDLVIMEHDDQGRGSDAMDNLRRSINQPQLAVRFVAYHDENENGWGWANAVALEIRHKGYINMGVSWSPRGEYVESVDILVPSEVSA